MLFRAYLVAAILTDGGLPYATNPGNLDALLSLSRLDIYLNHYMSKMECLSFTHVNEVHFRHVLAWESGRF